MVLGTLPKIDRDNHNAHRRQGAVQDGVCVSADFLAHPRPAMNVQDGWERPRTLRLVDGCLERLPIDLQVVDVACLHSKWLAGQTNYSHRSCRRE